MALALEPVWQHTPFPPFALPYLPSMFFRRNLLLPSVPSNCRARSPLWTFAPLFFFLLLLLLLLLPLPDAVVALAVVLSPRPYSRPAWPLARSEGTTNDAR